MFLPMVWTKKVRVREIRFHHRTSATCMSTMGLIDHRVIPETLGRHPIIEKRHLKFVDQFCPKNIEDMRRSCAHSADEFATQAKMQSSVCRAPVSAAELLVAFLVNSANLKLNAGTSSKSTGFPSPSCASCVESGSSSSLPSFSVANSCSASLSSDLRSFENTVLGEVGFHQDILKVASGLTKKKQQSNWIRFKHASVTSKLRLQPRAVSRTTN